MKILKINGLKKGWCDRNNLLLYSSFQILVDFIEEEKPGEIVDWNYTKKHKHVWKEIKESLKEVDPYEEAMDEWNVDSMVD